MAGCVQKEEGQLDAPGASGPSGRQPATWGFWDSCVSPWLACGHACACSCPAPCRWKVGFLASQLPRALPTRLLHGGGPGGSGGGGEAAGSGEVDDDGLLLVGWWVPEQ